MASFLIRSSIQNIVSHKAENINYETVYIIVLSEFRTIIVYTVK